MELLDFGKMGKWSKETLVNMVKYYGFNSQFGHMYDYDTLEQIYNSKLKKVNLNKKVWKMDVGEILREIKKNEYNKALEDDYNKMRTLIQKHYEIENTNTKLEHR